MIPAAEPRAPRWRRSPQTRPDAVLEAALDQFAARGFAATRMEDVAAAAGLSKAALYLYFPSKDALFRALVERRIRPLQAHLEAVAAADLDPIAGLRAITTAWSQAMDDPRLAAIPRIVLAEASRFPEIAAFYHGAVVARVSALIERLIAVAVAQGLFRPVSTEAASRALIAPLLIEIWRREAFAGLETRKPLGVAAEDILDLFLNGVAVAPGARP